MSQQDKQIAITSMQAIIENIAERNSNPLINGI
jgi:hypothetical protein